MAKFPYLSRWPDHMTTYGHAEMRRLAGVPEEHIKRMPPELFTAPRYVEGIWVRVMSGPEAKAFWGNPHTNTPMRVIAECPECRKIVPASRINQHAKVHQS